MAFAGQLFGIEVKVYMVRVSYDQKPYRRNMMETWGATVVASPSTDTNTGRKVLEDDPNCTGSLGLAISEAVEDAVTNPTPTKYALGSVLNHVLMHQTVIGQESKRQLDMAGVYPDVVVGCIGGAYDFGDTSMLTPLVKMYTLGHGFMPAPIHAGGLRYHGMASSICELYRNELIEARAVQQLATFEAGVLFARTEGIVSAPEAAHAIRGAIDEAIRCREEGRSEVIAFNLCGHGHFDMTSYEKYFAGKLVDYELPQTEIDRAVAQLPTV
jgi:tryptophan synthase beta chain